MLAVSAGGHEETLPLVDGAFAYTYRQSIYDVGVREELRAGDGGIAIERAESPDRRALEYFRWPGEAFEAGAGTLAWRAPPNATAQLRILVVSDGQQRIEAGPRRLDLYSAFGDDASVSVRPARRPLFAWLWSLIR